MIVTYSPSDGDAQSWDFDPARLGSAEAEVVEQRYGGRYPEWVQDVESGGVRARRLLLWLLLRRAHPTLRHDDVSFEVGQFEVAYTRAELQERRDAVAASGLTEFQGIPVSLALQQLDAAIADAPGEAAGKALGPSAG